MVASRPFTGTDKDRIEHEGRCPACGHQRLVFDGDFLDPTFICDECGERVAPHDTGASQEVEA